MKQLLTIGDLSSQANTSRTLLSWQRQRSTSELIQFITRREAVLLSQAGYDEVL